MKINRIEPQGYCGGVKNALDVVYRALQDSSIPRPIYLLGSIIHNRHVIEDLKEKGVILVEEKGKTRLELLENVSCGTIVFSAHGVSPIVRKKAKEKGLNILDTTCGNVQIIHKRIQDYLDLGYTCLYIGMKNHPECEGILGISSSIILLETIKDVETLTLPSNKIYVTNQTTLSLYETKEIYEKISRNYPNAILDNKICIATSIRQEAMLQQKPVDLCLVVGDAFSSNTKKLVQASNSIGIPTLLVDNLSDVKKIDFKNFQSISVTSGASTPKEIVDEIIKYLKEL